MHESRAKELIPFFRPIVNSMPSIFGVSIQSGVFENGIGEGVVWVANFKDIIYRFKAKGEKHSATKVKKMVSVDVEKLNSIQEFVEYSVTESRFNQAVEKVFGENELDVKKMGDFIRWFINDISSEEMDTMLKNGLEPKDVNKYISSKAREMFFDKQKQF